MPIRKLKYFGVMQGPLARRLVSGSAWSLVASVCGGGGNLVLFMFVARILGKLQYGELVLLQSTLGTIGSVAGLGLGMTATRYAAHFNGRDNLRLARILALCQYLILGCGAVVVAILYLGADILARDVLNTPQLATLVRIAAIGVLLTGLDGYQKATLIGFEDMRAFSMSTIYGSLAMFPLMLVGAFLWGVVGAAIALTVGYAVQAAISRQAVSHTLRAAQVSRRASRITTELSVLWHFALPAFLAGIIIGPSHWAVQAILTHNVGGLGEVALFGIALQWITMIAFVPAAVSRAIGPALIGKVASRNRNHSTRILGYTMILNAMVTIPAAAATAFFSNDIIRLYGRTFRGGGEDIVLAAIIGALVGIQAPIGSLIAAESKMWLGALMNGTWACLYLCLAFVLSTRGAIGALSALLVAYVIHGIWSGWFAVSRLRKGSGWLDNMDKRSTWSVPSSDEGRLQ